MIVAKQAGDFSVRLDTNPELPPRPPGGRIKWNSLCTGKWIPTCSVDIPWPLVHLHRHPPYHTIRSFPFLSFLEFSSSFQFIIRTTPYHTMLFHTMLFHTIHAGLAWSLRIWDNWRAQKQYPGLNTGFGPQHVGEYASLPGCFLSWLTEKNVSCTG